MPVGDQSLHRGEPRDRRETDVLRRVARPHPPRTGVRLAPGPTDRRFGDSRSVEAGSGAVECIGSRVEIENRGSAGSRSGAGTRPGGLETKPVWGQAFWPAARLLPGVGLIKLEPPAWAQGGRAFKSPRPRPNGCRAERWQKHGLDANPWKIRQGNRDKPQNQLRAGTGAG